MKIDKNILEEEGKAILFARWASILYNGGDIEEAVKICENGLKQFPTYAQAHFILAKCYQKKEMIEEARSEFERVLRYDPNHLNAIKELMKIFQQNGLDDIYKEYLLKLFTLDPLNAEVIEEVKKIGKYEAWCASVEELLPEEKPAHIDEQEVDTFDIPSEIEEENMFDIELEDRAKEVVDPSKLDLSQFDNREDDFTTIMDGIFKPGARADFEDRSTEDENIDETGLEEKQDLQLDIDQVTSEEDASIEDEAGDHFHEEELEEPLFPEKNDSLEDEKSVDSGDDLNIDNKSETADDSSSLDLNKDDIAESQEEISFEAPPDPNGTENDMLSVPKETTLPETLLEESEHPDMDDSEDGEPQFQKPKIISQTLGEILVSQKKYKEAKQVFEALKEKQPDNLMLEKKIALIDQIIALEE